MAKINRPDSAITIFDNHDKRISTLENSLLSSTAFEPIIAGFGIIKIGFEISVDDSLIVTQEQLDEAVEDIELGDTTRDHYIATGSSNQSVSTSGTNVTFPTLVSSHEITEVDDHTFVVAKEGLYDVKAFVRWGTNTTNSRALEILHNTASTWTDRRPATQSGIVQTISGTLVCSAEDEIQIFANQNSGDARTITDRRIAITYLGKSS